MSANITGRTAPPQRHAALETMGEHKTAVAQTATTSIFPGR
jgi:hypothetical protein